MLLVYQSADRELAPTPGSVFPVHVGRYTLVGIREDRESTRSLLYKWGSYSRGGQGSEIELGLWYPAGIHYPTWCHLARGEEPVWTGVEILPTAEGRRNTFQLTAYDQGGAYLLEASTICTLNGCFEEDLAAPQVGVRFISPGIHNLIFESSFLSRPLLIRTTSTASAPLSTKQTAMSISEIADFVSGLRSSEVDRFVYFRDR